MKHASRRVWFVTLWQKNEDHQESAAILRKLKAYILKLYNIILKFNSEHNSNHSSDKYIKQIYDK